MIKYLYNPPLPVKFLFKEFAWNSVSGQILFTFDDGPVAGNTEGILKKLDELKFKAIFFCVGNNVRYNRSLINEILVEGHTIGNHTMNHKVLTRAGLPEMIEEIIPFNKIMEDEFGYKVDYFRPPHGKFNLKLRSYLNYIDLKCVMWSLLTYDYKNNIDEVKKSLKHLKGNSIIVLHDSLKSKEVIIAAIDLISESILSNNFSVGTPPECLK